MRLKIVTDICDMTNLSLYTLQRVLEHVTKGLLLNFTLFGGLVGQGA